MKNMKNNFIINMFGKINIYNTSFYKLYQFLRYDIIRFFKNIIRFRKELLTFNKWDYTYNLQIFKRSIELSADYIEKYSYEIDTNKIKKIQKMRRVIELINNHIDWNYKEIAEKELNYKSISNIKFVSTDDNTNSVVMVDECSDDEKELNNKILLRSIDIEEEEWDELYKILKGQKYTLENGDFDDFFDGSGLRGWWS